MNQDSYEDAYHMAEIMRSNGADGESLISFFKSVGVPQGLTALFLKELGVGSYIECKNLVLNSDSWKDVQEVNKQLHKYIGDLDIPDSEDV